MIAEGALPRGNLQIYEGRNKSSEIERGCMQIARIENDLIFPILYHINNTKSKKFLHLKSFSFVLCFAAGEVFIYLAGARAGCSVSSREMTLLEQWTAGQDTERLVEQIKQKNFDCKMLQPHSNITFV
ncbi:hypothetical protein Peur_026649 [Populus x canadensis]